MVNTDLTEVTIYTPQCLVPYTKYEHHSGLFKHPGLKILVYCVNRNLFNHVIVVHNAKLGPLGHSYVKK